MPKRIFLIRHCKAEGQEQAAPLTEQGALDAIKLARFLKDQKIDAIYSSPFSRAIQTATPLAETLGLSIHSDNRLQERVLSAQNLPDWMECLKLTFEDMTLKYLGGESSEEAMNRAIAVVGEILASQVKSVAIVTHGNLLSLILNHYDTRYGFEAWRALSNPDVFELTFETNTINIERVWS